MNLDLYLRLFFFFQQGSEVSGRHSLAPLLYLTQTLVPAFFTTEINVTDLYKAMQSVRYIMPKILEILSFTKNRRKIPCDEMPS
jgi:hypothetical protein